MLRDPVRLGLTTLALVLTVSLAHPLSRLVEHALGYYPETSASKRVDAPPLRTQAVDLTSILTLAPFGVAPRSRQNAAETGSLSLLGVIHASPSTRSTALISDAGRPAKAFRARDPVADGIVLDAVGSDHVVLLASGHRQTLGFLKTATVKTAPVMATSSFGLPDARMFAPAVQRTPDEVIDVYRQRIAADPQAVIDDLGVSATSEGYRVDQRLTPQLRRVGLRPGDLVVRINGKPVGNMGQDRANFDDIALSDRARVEIKRDGRLLTLSFPLR
ncbi:MAG: type II secretion system protein N [Alphaproteobacteria bacterium]|nr:type II secretion system protein N [Alphaproteobacteria bacterium]